MTERRRSSRLRMWLEIIGAVIAASAVYVAVAQYEYARHKDARDSVAAEAEKTNNALLEALKAETEARKDGDGKITRAVEELVHSQATQTQAITTLVTEMRFILRKLDLDGEIP